MFSADTQPDMDDKTVERVAKALYSHALKEAITSIDNLKFDFGDIPNLFERLRLESEVASVLIFSSFIEEKITALIKLRLFHLNSPKIEDTIFGSNGPLGTFGSRVSLSHQLGWISPTLKKKLDAFRKIRNAFAHNAYQVSLTDRNISDLIKVIDYDVLNFIKPIRKALTNPEEEDPILPDEKITEDLHFLCNLAILLENTISDFLCLPTAISHRVDPKSILGSYDNGPELTKNLKLALSETILSLLFR